jgi:hypothetical protein
MSKFISRIVATVAFAGLLNAPLAQADDTETVNLSGSVAQLLEITATPTAAASTLNLSGGEKIVQVADLAIITNSENGFTLSASSGSLTKAGGTAIPFQVHTVLSGAQAPVSGAFVVDSGDDNTSFGSVDEGSVDGDLYIKYTPATLQDPGSYSGSINLLITDNN